MSSKWYSTLDENKAQFGGYRVNPETPSERILTRIFYGIDKEAFPTLRATIDATSSVVDPKIDNQKYDGTWRIGDMRTEEGTGELSGSLTVYQDIANGLNGGQGADNEYLAGMQSQLIELIEYRWMTYQHYKQTVTKKWVNMTSSSAVAGFGILSQINMLSDIASGDYSPETTDPLTWTWWNAVYMDDTMVTGGLKWDHSTGTIVFWKYPSANYGKFYQFLSYNTDTNSLVATEIEQPNIESCYYQEEKDKSFTLYQSVSTLTYPAIMRETYYQYAGLIVTSALPVEGNNAITLSGFLNQTETIYKNARFRIGSDTYRVTDDTECVAGVVTVLVTPLVTAATAAAYIADPVTTGTQVFFNAIG